MILSLLLPSCTTSVKDPGERAIFTNEIVDIRGRTVGLKDRYRRVYVLPFSEQIGSADVLAGYEKLLRDQLAQYGLSLSPRIPGADAVVDGALTRLVVSDADRATNVPGLIYTLHLTYSVLDSRRSFIQRDRPIREDILVLDTNAYLSNDVVFALATNAARHTAEAVFYGWQLEYSKTPDKILTLGIITNETNTGTNRTK